MRHLAKAFFSNAFPLLACYFQYRPKVQSSIGVAIIHDACGIFDIILLPKVIPSFSIICHDKYPVFNKKSKMKTD